jgi:hypothetical protein
MTGNATIELIWHGEKPDNAEDAVIADMREADLLDIKPEDLIFHTVWLTDDMEGPHVLVWGENGAFHAKYDDKSGLVHLGTSFPGNETFDDEPGRA